MTQVKFNTRPFNGSLNSIVNELFSDLPVIFNEGYSGREIVPANIKETKDAFELDIIAPGFEKTDFSVNLDQNILTIAAEKKNEVVSENEKQIRKEYSYKSFKRSFTIDDKIDATGIGASYVNGVLRLNLPKKAEVKQATKEITIS